MPAAAFSKQAAQAEKGEISGKEIRGNRSLGRPLCCSSVTERCGYAPSSRRVAGPNLRLRHPRLFMRCLPVDKLSRRVTITGLGVLDEESGRRATAL